MGKEIFTIQLGKCGIQTGHEFWKIISGEHFINPEGKIFFKKKKNLIENKEIFFSETSKGTFLPRTFLFDLEPRILFGIINGNYQNFYEKKNILFSKQSAGNNWAIGYYKSIEFQSEIEEILRKNLENCDNLGCFNIFHSIAGGTGSGTGSYLMEIIREEFSKKIINCYSIIPNRIGASDTVIQPYNSILSFRWLTLFADCVTFFENSALEKIISSLNPNIKPDSKEINYLISKIISISSENIRFSENFKNSWENQFSSLIPTPKLHFFSAGISNLKFFNKKKKKFSNGSLHQVFDNKTTSFSFSEGKLISSLLFSQNQSKYFNEPNILKKLHEEKKIAYTSWGSVPVNIFNLPSSTLNDSTKKELCFYNHTNIKKFFSKNKEQYDIFRKKNAFLNNYLKNFPSNDGIELFTDAKESVENLIEEYEVAETSKFF